MKFPRLFGWLMATVLLLAIIGLLYPQQLPVSFYKLSLVSMAGVVGYWLDRSLFPYARPDSFIVVEDDGGGVALDTDADADYMTIPWGAVDAALAALFAAAMLRRAIIVGSAMLAIGLGA